MTSSERLSIWTREVSSAFAQLNKAQRVGLALWSAGIAWTGCAGIAQISALLALVLEQGEQSVTQRLREWYLDAWDKGGKRGEKRREIDVTRCFAPLLRWVVRLWPSESKRLVLVVDATTLGERWTILVISVVLCGCAIPVAWKVLPGKGHGSWRPHWEALLQSLAGAIPEGWEVLVQADRGLYARWLWDAIRACGWHPYLRLNLRVKARQVGTETFEWVSQWVPTPGSSWQGRVECFASKHSRVLGTLLLHWEVGYETAWIILTDLAPETAQCSWYGQRTWIETGFKDFKRGGWDWQHTKMTQASRVERLWLAMAVAQLWCVSLGCQAEECQEQAAAQHEPGADLSATHIARRKRSRPTGQPPIRRLSCAMRGRLVLLARLVHDEPLPLGHLRPGPWPQTVRPLSRPFTPAQGRKRERRRAKERRRSQKQHAKARAGA